MRETNTNQSQRWAGCSDNVQFGSELARKFVNLRERVTKNRTSLLNVHNNQVGIRVMSWARVNDWTMILCFVLGDFVLGRSSVQMSWRLRFM